MRGFTLAEILLGLALLSVAVLTLLGLSLRTLSANSKSLDTAAGQMVADQALSRLAYAAENNQSHTLWDTNTTTAFSSENVTMGASDYQVTLYISDVVGGGGEFQVSGKRLKLMQARVLWRDAPEGKAQQGTLRVEASRLLHEP